MSNRDKMIIGGLIAAIVFVLASFAFTLPDPAPRAPISAKDRAAVLRPGHVTKIGFEAAGMIWPFSVPHGRIGCTGNSRWFESGGTSYGLNGFSKSHGYPEPNPVWLPDEKIMGELEAAGSRGGPIIRLDIQDMINEAGKLCGEPS